MKTLNLSQIKALYNFTRQHYVEHYDLQTELVDHLANDIEAIWENQPELSFEATRDKSFKKFGIFGFMIVVEQRQKAMAKRYRNYLFEEIKSWFAIPKIIITVSLFALIYFVLMEDFSSYIVFGLSILTLIFGSFKSYKLIERFNFRKKHTGKKWMLEELIFKQAGITNLILISQLPTWYDMTLNHTNSEYTAWTALAWSIVTTILLIWSYIALHVHPKKADTLLKATYPEFKIT